jgi:hypothetical protein
MLAQMRYTIFACIKQIAPNEFFGARDGASHRLNAQLPVVNAKQPTGCVLQVIIRRILSDCRFYLF